MRNSLLALLLLLAPALHAFPRDTVFLSTIEQRDQGQTEVWLEYAWPGWTQTSGFGFVLTAKAVPVSPGLFAPSPDRLVFAAAGAGTLAWWDGVTRFMDDTEPAYHVIAETGAALGEIAPMKSGNFLVAERSAPAARGARLFEFNLGGIVRSWELPRSVDWTTGRAMGAPHLELLADQCTLLYSHGRGTLAQEIVRRYDICRSAPLPDFAVFTGGEPAGSMRQLPGGNIVVASTDGAQEFDPSGAKVRFYYATGESAVALNSDGTMLWVGGAAAGRGYAVQYRVGNGWTETGRIKVGGPGTTTLYPTVGIESITVVGEWRSSSPLPARGRATRR